MQVASAGAYSQVFPALWRWLRKHASTAVSSAMQQLVHLQQRRWYSAHHSTIYPPAIAMFSWLGASRLLMPTLLVISQLSSDPYCRVRSTACTSLAVPVQTGSFTCGAAEATHEAAKPRPCSSRPRVIFISSTVVWDPRRDQIAILCTVQHWKSNQLVRLAVGAVAMCW